MVMVTRKQRHGWVTVTKIQTNSYRYAYANGRVFYIWKHNSKWHAQEAGVDGPMLIGPTRGSVAQRVTVLVSV